MTKEELRAKFLATSIKPGSREPVTVPELGTVYIPRLSIRHAENAAKAIKGADQHGSAAALIVAITLDEHGERVFADEDIAAVADMPAEVGGPIIAKYEEMNGTGSKASFRGSGDAVSAPVVSNAAQVPVAARDGNEPGGVSALAG